MNHLIEKGKSRCKISYKLSKEEYRYDPFLGISPFPTLIQLKDFLGGIKRCVTVVGKWIFDSDIIFSHPITRDNLEYCFTNDDLKNKLMVTKEYSKPLSFSQQIKIKVSSRSKNP